MLLCRASGHRQPEGLQLQRARLPLHALLRSRPGAQGPSFRGSRGEQVLIEGVLELIHPKSVSRSSLLACYVRGRDDYTTRCSVLCCGRCPSKRGLYGNLQFNFYDPQWAKVVFYILSSASDIWKALFCLSAVTSFRSHLHKSFTIASHARWMLVASSTSCS